MDRSSPNDWPAALLTAGSFLAMVVTGVVAGLDAIDGSPGYGAEFAVALACGVSFSSLLASELRAADDVVS